MAEQFPGGGGAARGGGIAQRVSSSGAVHLVGVRLFRNAASGGKFAGVIGGRPTTDPLPPAGDATGGAVAAAGVLQGQGLNAAENSATGGRAAESCFITPCAPITCPFGMQCTAGASRGGALAARATASITASTFTQNQAISGDTRIYCVTQTGSCDGSNAAIAAGGAVWSERQITLAHSNFSVNVAKQGVGLGGVDGVGRGGAVASDADLTVEGGEYAQNSATVGHGGAISASAVTIKNATFTGNTASGRAGAIDAASLNAATLTAVENRAGGSGGGAVAVSGDASISDSSINRNSVDSRQRSGTQTTARGGGISVAGHLTLSASQVIGNTGDAELYFGTFCSSCAATFLGGGIAAGSVTGEAVTIADNRAGELTILPGAPSFFVPGVSGGGGIAATGTVTLRNATVSGNTTDAFPSSPATWIAPARGAAVLAARVELDHATIADNLNAPSLQVSQLAIQRSVVIAPAPQTACAAGTQVASSSYSLVSDASCGLAGVGDQQGVAEFLLGPLSSNGGPVPTRLPAFASVLRDYIPPSACPLPMDARGVTRPQGPRCDVGAAEFGAVAGTGATDLAIAFTNPPASVTAGSAGTWEITVSNRGPAVALPAVRVEVPDRVTVRSVTASGGAACSDEDPVLCVWSSPIPAGGSATISVEGIVATELTGGLAWSAQVFAPELAPPLADDRAELTTPTSVSSGVTMALRFRPDVDELGRRMAIATVALSNSGPSNAVGSETQPIEVLFQPASGVSVEAHSETRLVGSFAPGGEPFAHVEFVVRADGPAPARLGTISLLTGVNPQPPVADIAVVHADLELRIFRSSAPQTAGTPLPFRYEVTNHGPSTAPDVRLEIRVDGPTYTWSAGTGQLENVSEGPPGVVWRVGSLAPGATATLAGTVIGAVSYSHPALFL
ncbi:MAG TPA: choice-of-anchor Q domain-containing protein, partial [Polyangiaceae bacterium]|nr:choice-of-anchor Q domain-containing protein [Polyangiaceae bacterium]